MANQLQTVGSRSVRLRKTLRQQFVREIPYRRVPGDIIADDQATRRQFSLCLAKLEHLVVIRVIGIMIKYVGAADFVSK